jgi:hypothetical protein
MDLSKLLAEWIPFKNESNFILGNERKDDTSLCIITADEKCIKLSSLDVSNLNQSFNLSEKTNKSRLPFDKVSKYNI